jgi:transketolase
MDTMRERFTKTTTDLLDERNDVVVVLADIGVTGFVESGAANRHPERVINVGIREQLMIGVAGGLALEGMRPIVHSYAPFLVERPYEFLKLSLGHQDVDAVLVSIGASYDAAAEGRTHQAPGDVALVSLLPGWSVHVPGTADEAELLLRFAIAGGGRHYIRLSAETNATTVTIEPGRLVPLRTGSLGLVVAVGQMLEPTLEATADMDVTVLYASTVVPLDGAVLRAHLPERSAVVLVEPYATGTSAHRVAAHLGDVPHRLLSLGVGNAELRKYGTRDEHRAAHGLDAAGIRASVGAFLAGGHREALAVG